MSSFENVEVFEDTKRMCETNGKIKNALTRSVKNQKLILEGTELPAVDKVYFSDEAKIIVSTKRTFEAAADYAGQKVAVHNFASATNPGGGVTRGDPAHRRNVCVGVPACISA